MPRKCAQMSVWAHTQFQSMARDVGISMTELFDQLAARMLAEEKRKRRAMEYSNLHQLPQVNSEMCIQVKVRH